MIDDLIKENPEIVEECKIKSKAIGKLIGLAMKKIKPPIQRN